MMKNGVQASIPKVRDDPQCKREIENAKTTQGEQGHHLREDARICARCADLRGQSVQAKKADK